MAVRRGRRTGKTADGALGSRHKYRPMEQWHRYQRRGQKSPLRSSSSQSRQQTPRCPPPPNARFSTAPFRTRSDGSTNKVNTLRQRATLPTTSPTFALRRVHGVSTGHAGCAMNEVKDPDQVVAELGIIAFLKSICSGCINREKKQGVGHYYRSKIFIASFSETEVFILFLLQGLSSEREDLHHTARLSEVPYSGSFVMFTQLHLQSMPGLLCTEVHNVSFIFLFAEFTVPRQSPIPCPGNPGISAEAPETDVVLGHGIETHRRRPQDTTDRVRQRNLAIGSL